MKISVIVPFLNEEKYIDKCIKSLINQEFPKKDYELIFIDNGSIDKSAEIVKKYKKIKLLYEKVKNVYIARNKALKIAKGKYIAFTDADCEVSKDWLTQIYKKFESDKNTYAVLGKRNFPNKKNYLLQIFADYENAKIEYVLKNLDKEYFFGFTNNMAIRKVVLSETGLFKTRPNNGDTQLIQSIATTFGDESILCLSNMSVNHLEVDGIPFWINKIRSYGTENRLLEERSSFRSLKLIDNLKIYKYLVKNYKYSLVKKIATLVALSVGALSYKVVF